MRPMPTRRTPKGTASVSDNHGSIVIRYRWQGQRHKFSPGRPYTLEGLNEVGPLLKALNRDLEDGCPDLSHEKYLTILRPESSQPQNRLSLQEIYLRYSEFKQPQVSPSTYRSHYIKTQQRIEKLPMQDPEQAMEILDYSMKTWGPEVTKPFLVQLNAACAYAKDQHLLQRNPFDGLGKKIKVPRKASTVKPFTKGERKKIIQGFEESRYYRHYAPFISFLLYCGARPSEIVGLTGGQVGQDAIQLDRAVVEGPDRVMGSVGSGFK